MVDLSKFISNKKKLLNGIVALFHNQVYCQSCPSKKKKFIVKVCSKFNYVRTKKNLGWSQSFFKNKKIINF